MSRVWYSDALLSMIDFSLSTPPLESRSGLDTKIFGATVEAVREWLNAKPNAGELVSNLPALELALAAHIKNHEQELFTLTRDAMQRVNAGIALENISLEILAALIVLNLHLFQISRDANFQDAAQRLTAQGIARFDTMRGFFRTPASDDENAFYTDANAQLADAFYFAWRVLDQELPRPIAGEVLGHVGDVFETSVGLYQRSIFSDGLRAETRHLPAYAAAMQMFMTASEMTARGTYTTRARILGDYALANFLEDAARTPFTQRAQFAEALTRLLQFTNEDAYRHAAHTLLSETADVPHGIGAANFALAVEHASHFPLHIVIIGDMEKDENAQALWRVAWNTYASAHAMEVLDPQHHAARIQTLGYFGESGSALAYICIGPLCLPPVHSVEQFLAAVQGR